MVGIVCYSLRRTAATIAARSGDPFAVQRLLGAGNFGKGVGRVYVYWGSELANPDTKPGRILTGEDPKDWFGHGLTCGDINNDGYDDLVVGAYTYKAGAKQRRVYLYYIGPPKK